MVSVWKVVFPTDGGDALRFNVEARDIPDALSEAESVLESYWEESEDLSGEPPAAGDVVSVSLVVSTAN